MSSKKKKSQKKLTKHEFQTRDIVALYLGKFRHEKQIETMNQIGALITGIKNFTFKNLDHRNKANATLASQHQWLPSLEYNREGYDKWMVNIEDNHGKTLILEL